MTPNILTLIQNCQWFPSHFLIISENVFSPLLYYSYFAAAIPVIIIGLLIFLNGRKKLENRLLFLTTISLALWVFCALITWATEFPKYTMFFWALLIILEPLISFFAFYFSFVFFFKRDFSTIQKIIFSLPLLPIIILLPTRFTLLGYDLSNCDRAAIEGVLVSYAYITEIIFAVLIIIIGVIAFRKIKDLISRRQIVLVTIGILFFLLSFNLGNILESFTDNWYIGQYGLFGAPVFMAFLAYMIVKFKTFDIKLIGAQALVWALVILVGMEFLFVNDPINQIMVAVTLVVSGVLGLILIRSVKKEIALRESLEISNKGQENLIHIMNHQIKGFFGVARNIFAELLQSDDYGHMPEESKPLLEKGLESTAAGVNYVQEILRGSSAEKGLLSYDMKPIDIKSVVLSLLSEQKDIIQKKGLSFESKIVDGNYNTIGDAVQLKEAFKNLITNAIKYNDYRDPNCGIKISLMIKNNKIVFSVRDTGVGISEEDKQRLFIAGGMGKNSISLNVEASGFGLAFVKGVAEAHKGIVGYKSNEPQKGTTFYIELPLVKTI
ncbi:MAG: HAMP domain-containing sensor histidine kinase [Candidatus Taylorbacteria bacterium]|nr:HAMP domain-containing sensor histidine kinase [Candidatus Taylorbacteria bacterium]